MELFDAIKGRRSIRKLDPTPLGAGVLEKVLDVGRYAPSWANTQCWEIIVVKNEETKGLLSQLLSEANPARRAVVEAPVVLVACGQKQRSGFKKGQEATELGDWLMFDVALYLHTVTLAAHALGLETVHVGLFDHEKVASLLGVPDDVQVVEIVPMGHPLKIPDSAPARKEAVDFVHFDRF